MTWEPEWQCELIQVLTEALENVNMGLITNLIGSIQQRIQWVIQNEGKSGDVLSKNVDRWRSDSQIDRPLETFWVNLNNYRRQGRLIVFGMICISLRGVMRSLIKILRMGDWSTPSGRSQSLRVRGISEVGLPQIWVRVFPKIGGEIAR
jgi:hypothetical protein